MDDGAALLCQVVQHPLHDGRVVAAVCAEFFTQADLSVVVGNHLLDARGTDSRVGGEIFSLFGSVVEIVFDVFRHAELVVQQEDLVCVSLALCEIHGRCLVQVGEERAGLVVRNLLVHIAEFFAQCVETFGDELVGAFRHSVAVFEPLFVIDFNEFENHVFGALAAGVGEVDVQDGCFFVGEGDGESAGEGAGNGFDRIFRHGDFLVGEGFSPEFCRLDDHFPDGSASERSHVHGDFFLVDAMVCDEIPEFCFFVREQFHFEGASELVACFGHEECDGRVVIERCVV